MPIKVKGLSQDEVRGTMWKSLSQQSTNNTPEKIHHFLCLSMSHQLFRSNNQRSSMLMIMWRLQVSNQKRRIQASWRIIMPKATLFLALASTRGWLKSLQEPIVIPAPPWITIFITFPKWMMTMSELALALRKWWKRSLWLKSRLSICLNLANTTICSLSLQYLKLISPWIALRIPTLSISTIVRSSNLELRRISLDLLTLVTGNYKQFLPNLLSLCLVRTREAL